MHDFAQIDQTPVAHEKWLSRHAIRCCHAGRDDIKHGHFSVPFTTYYEQVDTVNWFPTYTHADGTVHFAASKDGPANDIHMRNTVKYTDYRRFRSTARIIYNGQDITDQAAPNSKAPQPESQQAPEPTKPKN